MRARLYYSAVVLSISLLIASAVRSAIMANMPAERISNGTLLIQTMGYHDVIRIAARVDSTGSYRELHLLESSESPLYASEQDIRAYISRLEGFEPKEISRVDGITGATFTTEAIQAALMQTSPFIRWVEMLVYLLLWIMTLIFAIRRKRRILFALSCVWFIVVGVLYNSSVGVYSLFKLPWVFHPLPLLALLSVLLYRNLYCSHVCPFGFLQRLTRKIPAKRRYRLPSTIKAAKYIVLSMAVLSALLTDQLYLEPYSFLFSRKPKLSVYLLPAVFLSVSFFIPRFWCRGFCPVGALMRIGRGVRRWIVELKSPRLSLPGYESHASIGLALLTFGTILISNVLLYVG